MFNEKNIWIYAEHKNMKISDSFYELLSKAQVVAKALQDDTKIAAVVLGDEIEEVVEELKISGVDIVYAASHPKLKQYDPEYYPAALTTLSKKYQPKMIWIGASFEGSELAPSVAAKLKTGLAAHCVDILVNPQGEIVHMVPAFGGKMLSEILIPNSRPIMASIKPGVFRKEDIETDIEAEVIWDFAEILDTFESRFKLVSQIEINTIGLPVEKAEVIVAGGFGIGDAKTWDKVKNLATAINAAVGYTRPLVDIELEETDENMIGASGKCVRPKLYLAFGISGSSHHLCGMKDSGMIISVNTDKDADIFGASDYKVVADCDTILDELLKQLCVS